MNAKEIQFLSMRSMKIDKSELMFDNKFLKSLIIPLLVETLLSVTIGLMDTIMVSGVGEHAVSGVSLIDSISALFIFLFSAFATGGAVVASQYLGKGEPENARYSAKQLMYLSISFSVLVSVLLFIFRRQVLNLVYGSIEENVMDAALVYFEPILISFPFLAVLNSANALFRSMGKSRITMIVSIIMNVINVSGNYILINIVGLGTLGAGIASLASRMVACFYMVYKVTRTSEVIHIEEPLKFDLSIPMINRVLKVALPSGIENSMFHIGKILISSTVASFGTASIAANAVFNSVSTMSNIPGSAIGMASVTVIGQCCGAGKTDQAEYYGRKLMALTYMMMGVTCTLIFIAARPLAEMYNLSETAEALAIYSTRLNMIQTVLVWPLAFTLPNYLRAAGDARFTMLVSVASMWVFRVMLSIVLGKMLGIGFIGVCWGMFIDWYCRAIFFVIRFLKGKWKTKRVV